MAKLTEMEVECMEALRVFSIYVSAVDGYGHMEILHKVGVQGLTAGAVQMAAETFKKYKDAYLERLTTEEPEEPTDRQLGLM